LRPDIQAARVRIIFAASGDPTGIAENLADLFEATLVAGKPWAITETSFGTPAPPARIALDRDDRRLLLEAHERVLHGDLRGPAAEPHLAGLVRALAQVILDQDHIE
jgi:hypothetical protein